MKSFKILFTLLMTSMLANPLLATAADSTTAPNPLTPNQVTQVKKVVHEYLVTNPQVLVEASMALQKQEAQKVEEKSKQAISTNANQIFADPMSPVIGNPKGDVTVVEFFDYQCPHCKDVGPMLEKVLAADNNVRIVMKELPIFGAESKTAAQAALASQKQGADKYSKMHHALLAAENPLTKDKIMQLAKSIGLDTTQLSKDMESPDIQKQLTDNLNLAQAVGLMGTPTFIISRWKVSTNNSVGTTGNSVANALFVPGVVDAGKLQAFIAQTRK